MRMLNGVVAGAFWLTFLAVVTVKGGATIPSDMQWLTLSIIVAGAMAGGD